MAAQDFFGVATFAQVAGAVVLVTTVSTTVRRLTKLESPWVPFIVSILVTYLGAGLAGALDSGATETSVSTRAFAERIVAWVLPLLNGCLIFLAGVGSMEVGAAATRPTIPPGARPNAAAPWAARQTPSWLKSWFG